MSAAVVVILVVLALWGAWSYFIGRDVRYASDSPSTPSSLVSLTGKNIEPPIGDMVFLNDVTLKAGPTHSIFVVNGAQENRMLVVSEEGGRRSTSSELVDIKGTIRRLPDQATLRKVWKLSKEQVRFFSQQKIYLAAESIREERKPDSGTTAASF